MARDRGACNDPTAQRPAGTATTGPSQRMRRAEPADPSKPADGDVRAAGGRSARRVRQLTRSRPAQRFRARHGKVFHGHGWVPVRGDYVRGDRGAHRTLARPGARGTSTIPVQRLRHQRVSSPDTETAMRPSSPGPPSLLTTEAWRQEAISPDLGAAPPAMLKARESRTRSGRWPSSSELSRSQQFTAFQAYGGPTPFEPGIWRRLRAHSAPRRHRLDNPPGKGPETMQIDCDMSGGSSGGG